MLIDSNLISSDGYKIINLIANLNFQNKNCKIYLFSNSPKNFKSTSNITSLKMPKTLEMFKNTLKKIYNNLNNNNLITIKKPHTQKDWNTLLFELGFTITNSGTSYFSYILLKHKTSQNYNISMKNIYEDIANKFNITSDKAKWSIEKSIRSMRKNQDISKVYTILPSYDGREITAKYLLLMLLNTYN